MRTTIPGAHKTVPIDPSRHSHLTEVWIVTDYGGFRDPALQGAWSDLSNAEAHRNWALLTGRNPQRFRLGSANAFDNAGFGTWLASEGQNAGPHVAIFGGAAPGINKANGTERDEREALAVAKLRGGALVCAPDSSDSFDAIRRQGTRVFIQQADSPQSRGDPSDDPFHIDNSGTQFRGGNRMAANLLVADVVLRDPVLTASHYEGNDELFLGDRQRSGRLRWEYRSQIHPVRNDGVAVYVASDAWDDPNVEIPLTTATVPVGANRGDSRWAGFAIHQIARGGQLDQVALTTEDQRPPVPAIGIIDVEQSREAGTRILAQLNPHGFLVVGPADKEAWRAAPADVPIVDTGLRVGPGQSIHAAADRIFANLPQFFNANSVDVSRVREGMTVPTRGAVDFGCEPFGNDKRFDTVIQNAPDGTSLAIGAPSWPTDYVGEKLESLFARPIGAVGATRQGSSGGWPMLNDQGQVVSGVVSEVVRRIAVAEDGSIAGLFGKQQGEHTFERLDITVSADPHDVALAQQPPALDAVDLTANGQALRASVTTLAG